MGSFGLDRRISSGSKQAPRLMALEVQEGDAPASVFFAA